MWFSSALLFLAFTCAFADVEEDIQKCVAKVDMEELMALESKDTKQELEEGCPVVLELFDCLEEILREQTGMIFRQVAEVAGDTDIGKGAAVIANVIDLMKEICTEGSPLNEAWIADGECFDDMEEYIETCEDKYDAAVIETTLQQFVATVEEDDNDIEEDDDDEITFDMECISAAYKSACVASLIHDTCGRRAFDTYNTVIKRTSVFKNFLCTGHDLELLKTEFVDSLDEDEDRKALLRLAFDLRKRRK